MKRVTCVLALVLMVALCVPNAAFAKPVDQAGQTGQAEQGDNPGQDGQIEDGDNPGQEASGGKESCNLWKKIKAWMKAKAEKDAALLEKLMLIAKKDLEMCLSTMSGKGSCAKNIIPAVGHLNHALKALKDGKPPRHLKKAYKHLQKRISHAKFYIVMFNFDEASQRVESALEVIGELN